MEMTVNTRLPSSSPSAEWVSKQSSVRYMEWKNCLLLSGREGIQLKKKKKKSFRFFFLDLKLRLAQLFVKV